MSASPQTFGPLDASASLNICRVASLLDALQCGALLIDRNGTIIHVNRRLCEIMQTLQADLTGKTLRDLYPTGHGREIIEHALSHFEEPREQEFFLKRSDGVEVPIIVSGRRLPGDVPEHDHRILTVIDISQQKSVERELQERYREIARLSDTVLEQTLELKRYAQALEQRVQERTRDLHTANMEAIYMLAVACEAKDLDTGAHVRRIQHFTRKLADAMGIDEPTADRIAYSAILHDVGKIHVPDEILRKDGALSEAEWSIMRQHPIFGERILSREPFFDCARHIARSHHENWNGSGYPDGLKGDDIPLEARIVRVADVYDALTSVRPYKKAWPASEAADEIRRQSGRFFDPAIVKAFEGVHRQFER